MSPPKKTFRACLNSSPSAKIALKHPSRHPFGMDILYLILSQAEKLKPALRENCGTTGVEHCPPWFRQGALPREL